jgi:hypothetical protein
MPGWLKARAIMAVPEEPFRSPRVLPQVLSSVLTPREDGSIPYGSLIFGPGNALFGTTYVGGSGTCTQPSPGGCGTVFTIAS